ncbi:MAG TPA: hypothetical protein VIZ28_11155 [Chitinophagaceae bacterium]
MDALVLQQLYSVFTSLLLSHRDNSWVTKKTNDEIVPQERIVQMINFGFSTRCPYGTR